jgi:DNA recombination protein RmuC
VAIATPTTLMIALRTVANVWQAERRNRNAEAIAEHAGRIYDKFVGFLGDMGELGTRLGKARESYEGAMGKLSTGKGNLIRQVEQLKEMGAKTGKSIPHGLLEDVRAEALRKPEAETARAPA